MIPKDLFDRLKKHCTSKHVVAIAIIMFAGILIELMSLAQYRYAHNMIEEELGLRAENEMTLKSVRVRGMLKSSEKIVRNYAWPVQTQINNPANISRVLQRIVSTNHDVMSSFVAFVPGHIPGTDSLCEPGAYRKGDSIIARQLADGKHNYTQREFYHQAVNNGVASWSDPYVDTYASGREVVTFSMPLADSSGKTVAAFGIDLSTKGIIDTLNMKHRDESTFFLLLTEGGRLISQPDTSHAKWNDVDDVVRMINDSTVEREVSESGHGKVITFKDEDNSLGYIYYANMKGKPHWQIVMVCYDDEVFGKLNRMRRTFLLMMLAGFSLLGFILYRFNLNTQRLHRSDLSKERTDSELRIAQGIQSEMLPQHPIKRPDVEICGMQQTALEVGGDLYDYFVRDEKLFFCIGDVSGKGIPSSLVMAVVHSLFRSLSQHDSNPAHIMQSINRNACDGNYTNMFVTLFLGVLDLPTGRLRYCNAGHDSPLLMGKEVKPLPVNANLPVGVIEDFKYAQQQAQLTDGTTMFMYTDGLTEANNEAHKLFGLQRVNETAQACLDSGKTSPGQILTAMSQAVDRFAEGTQQSDDLTMLSLRFSQPKERVTLQDSITLLNDVRQVPELNGFVKSVAQRLNLASSLTSQLMLAVEEAVVNVMNYAYPMGTQGDVNIAAQATEKSLKFIITDEGKAFDPTQTNQVDTTLSAEERPIGGLGILLVHQLMDSINYERIDGKNVLTIKKSL